MEHNLKIPSNSMSEYSKESLLDSLPQKSTKRNWILRGPFVALSPPPRQRQINRWGIRVRAGGLKDVDMMISGKRITRWRMFHSNVNKIPKPLSGSTRTCTHLKPQTICLYTSSVGHSQSSWTRYSNQKRMLQERKSIERERTLLTLPNLLLPHSTAKEFPQQIQAKCVKRHSETGSLPFSAFEIRLYRPKEHCLGPNGTCSTRWSDLIFRTLSLPIQSSGNSC